MKNNKSGYADLTAMMQPASVAIIGATEKPGKVGYVIMKNYLDIGYTGKLYPVNITAQQGSTIQGVKAYSNISQIDERIDLAVIAIPAESVPKAIDDCGRAHVKSAVVVSGGFAEVGNVALEDRLKRIAEKYRIPIIGPNCLGVMDLKSKVDTLFLPTYKIDRPKVGSISFVSQSGAVGSTVLDIMAHEGFGLAKFISYGNATVVDEVDILHYLMNDDETRVIVWYIEGVKRGREFVDVAKKATRIKPVIIIKGGTTEQGALAAHSHTAALAGSTQAYDALFKQFGFIQARELEDLNAFAKVFDTQPFATGDRIAILTNGGGTGVIATDAIANSGLRIAQLSPQSTSKLKRVMPPIVNVRLPLDMAGDADAGRFAAAMDILSKDRGIDAFMVIALFQTPGADEHVAATMIKYGTTMKKPLVVVSPGGNYTQRHKVMMESSGVPVYDSPNAAARSLAALINYSRYRMMK